MAGQAWRAGHDPLERFLSESSTVGALAVDGDLRVLWSNSAFDRMAGMKGYGMGLCLTDLVAPEWREAAARLLSKGEGQQRLHFLGAGGAILLLTCRTYPGEGCRILLAETLARTDDEVLREMSRHQSEMANLGREVQRKNRELQHALSAVQQEERRFRTMADGAPVLIWMSGADKGCTWFNRPWLEFTGRTMEQERGNGWTEGLHPEDRQRCLDVYSEHFERREPFVMECRLRRRDGEHRWLVLAGKPLIDEARIFTGYVGSCIDIQDRREAEARLQVSESQLRALAMRLERVREEELATIARDLHDDLAQLLSGLGGELSRLERWIQAHGAPGWIEDWAVAATTLVDQAHASVRHLALSLRPTTLDHFGVGPGLQEEARRFRARAGVRCEVDVGPLPALAPECVTALYRIAQEALTNVARHAAASRVEIRLATEGDAVVLRVADDGCGPPEHPGAGPGLGLLGMRERAARLGGTAQLERRAQGGAVVVARLPFSK